ncbi:MAG: DUF4240 domain-containing protein [Lentisphaeria bacterium]|nr:DUF4240 domain-containing protein [Lentisphaeria bacterium]NQY67297.1 DUF4240 domain-containing protein [Flavobacteriales bacterium]
MDEEIFWDLIEESLQSVNNVEEKDAQLDHLIENLEKLSKDSILEFQRIMYQKFHALYSWDLYAAHSLLFGTSSDDNFQDFRAWIISCGKKYYQAALSDPELLSGLLDQGEYPVFEGFQKAGWRTFTILDITRNDDDWRKMPPSPKELSNKKSWEVEHLEDISFLANKFPILAQYDI